MTRPDLDAIRARCDAATPGPWSVSTLTYPNGTTVVESIIGVSEPQWSDYGEGEGEWYTDRLTLVETDAGVYGPTMSDAQFIAHARTDIPALLAYVADLERAVENEQLTFASCNRARIHCENECDSLHARINEMHDEIDKAQAAFDHGCGQDGPDGWEPGETAVDALVRAKHGRDALREEMFAWQHAVEYVLGEDWMAADGHGPKEARAELARRAKESADEYIRRRAACRVIDELEEQALTYKERLEQCEHELEQQARVWEQAMTEAQTDVRELRARIAELEKR